jgi:DNA-binding CsgD family transcriptional regulator
MEAYQHIQEVFFKCLSQFKYNEADLAYDVVPKHTAVLQKLSEVGNSGTGIFDLCKREIIYYSSNFGVLLGYEPADFKELGQQFFANKIHPDDALDCSINGVSALKIFNNFSSDEKFNHKLVTEYRMMNAHGQYVRLVEQYQILELDAIGQIWLMLSIVDVSPNQEISVGIKSQIINFRTGKIIPMESPAKVQVELTKRELEILKLVREGLLSKEISDKLSISVHTVNTHRQRFLEKLGANNSFEAVLFGAKFGLLD